MKKNTIEKILNFIFLIDIHYLWGWSFRYYSVLGCKYFIFNYFFNLLFVQGVAEFDQQIHKGEILLYGVINHV